MWMIQEAKSQRIKFNDNLIHSSGWDVVSSPIVHDKSINNSQRPGLSRVYDKRVLADRNFIYGNATSVKQTAAVIGGTSWAWAKNFVSYYSKTCGSSDNPAVGQVDMAKYSAWLATQGVNIGYAKPSATPLCN